MESQAAILRTEFGPLRELRGLLPIFPYKDGNGRLGGDIAFPWRIPMGGFSRTVLSGYLRLQLEECRRYNVVSESFAF